MASDPTRARRLLARKKAKAVLEPLRQLVRVLAEWERLDDADAVGVVEIAPRTAEAEYGADVLDIVGQAVGEAGEQQVVEVFVTISAANSIGHQSIGDRSCQEGSTQTRGRRRGRRGRSRSAASPTTPAD